MPRHGGWKLPVFMCIIRWTILFSILTVGEGSMQPDATISSNVIQNKPAPNSNQNKVEVGTEEDSSYVETSKTIARELRDIYKKFILPVEQKYHLSSFLLPKGGEIKDAEFDANPIVLLVGQYSTGKTTFIRHLIGGRDFPGIHIGPEPTTDKFVALAYGNHDNNEDNISSTRDDSFHLSSSNSPSTSVNHETKENIFQKLHTKKVENSRTPYSGKIIKGNSLTVISTLPFSSLSQFGSSFLTHFQGSILPAPLLQHLTLIDTPGILSGEKQRLARAYDFAQVSRWFADRADMILLLFDAHKLDISDELKDIMETIRPHNEDKIRCILNKADQVSREELVRVYGSLMWSMGKIFLTPENVRVYVGSFWDKPLKNVDFKDMFEEDENSLIHELKNLPRVAAERKVNEMVKRIRMVQVHVCILSRIRRYIRRKKNRDVVVEGLNEIVRDIKVEYNLSDGDIPDMELFADRLLNLTDWKMFPFRDDKKVIASICKVLEKTIPDMMEKAGGVDIGLNS